MSSGCRTSCTHQLIPQPHKHMKRCFVMAATHQCTLQAFVSASKVSPSSTPRVTKSAACRVPQDQAYPGEHHAKKHICIMQSTFEASCCDPKTLLGGAAIDAFAAVGCILFNYLVALPDLDQNEHKCIARIITPCMAPVQAIWQANITHG